MRNVTHFSCLFLLSLFACGSCRKDVEVNETKTISYLALGDSHTAGSMVLKDESYPFQLFELLDKDQYIEVKETRILATSGWTSSQLRNAFESSSFDHPYEIITLLIGTNNISGGRSIDEYKSDFRALLLNAIKQAGNNKKGVIVLSLPDHGYTPKGKSNQQKISKDVDVFNAVNKQLSDSLGVSYVDITSISRLNEPGLVSTDGFHVSAKQHHLWADTLYSYIRNNILGK